MKRLGILIVAVGIGMLILLSALLADAIQMFRFWVKRGAATAAQEGPYAAKREGL
jgi:hypothetical protein